MSDIIYSDEENAELTWSVAKDYVMRFGESKGKRLAELITIPKQRHNLRYYLTWADLKPVARSNIQCAIDYYEGQKKNRSK